MEYCNEDIKQVYLELFEGAREWFNVKQTRSDRKIDNYYEKIRTGKQALAAQGFNQKGNGMESVD